MNVAEKDLMGVVIKQREVNVVLTDRVDVLQEIVFNLESRIVLLEGVCYG